MNTARARETNLRTASRGAALIIECPAWQLQASSLTFRKEVGSDGTARLSRQWVLILLVVISCLVTPARAQACIAELERVVIAATVEERLGVSSPEAESVGDHDAELFQLSQLRICGLSVNRLDVHFKNSGLDQLANCLPADAMTEVLAGLRSRCRTPIRTSVEHSNRASERSGSGTQVKIASPPFAQAIECFCSATEQVA